MSHTDELARLAELHRNGDLTDAEFAAAKKGLLGTTNPVSTPEKVESKSAIVPIKASNEKPLDFDSLASSPVAPLTPASWGSQEPPIDESKNGFRWTPTKHMTLVFAGLIVVASIAFLGRHNSQPPSTIQTPTATQQPPANENSVPPNPPVSSPPPVAVQTTGIGKTRAFFTDLFQSQDVTFTRENDAEGEENYVGFIGSERQCIIQLIGPADNLKSASVTVTTEESNATALTATGDFMRRFAEIVIVRGAAWFDKMCRRAAKHVNSDKFEVEKTFGNITGKFEAADWGNGVGTMILTFSGS